MASTTILNLLLLSIMVT